jgi:DNA-binding NarL/FixJ family response regulator
MSPPTKVLLIDDEEAIRRNLRSFLTDSGYQVADASNGREGLAMFLREPSDIVLTDLRMAEGSGMELIKAMKSRSPDTPVIVVSGTGQIQDAIEAIRQGAWDYLVKPIEGPAVLQHAINRSLERQALLRQVREHQDHLEEQVRHRTAELQAANQALENKTVALREVLSVIQAEKREAVQSIVSRLERTVHPLLQRLRDARTSDHVEIVDHVADSIRQITSSVSDPLSHLASSLTPTEMRICRLIRQEMSSKEIARAEGISPETVETHRRNIRRKLKIANEQVNLATYLQSLVELDARS